MVFNGVILHIYYIREERLSDEAPSHQFFVSPKVRIDRVCNILGATTIVLSL